MPAEASGNRNYQGPAWYRKRFVVPAEAAGKNVSLHFEAAMGKQDIYINGKKIQEHIGGYLPFIVNLDEYGVQSGDSCLIAVMTDNSDDKSYPPGKRQYTLDFAYHGGIYRDVWMIAKSPVAITDAVEADKVAGGGVFVHYDNISKKSADVYVNTEVANKENVTRSVTVETTLKDNTGKVIKTVSQRISLKPLENKTIEQKFVVRNPNLWSPQSPYLYSVESRIKQGNRSIDGGTTSIGIRQAEFRGVDGFWLNEEAYGQLFDAHRHQALDYVRNATPNSPHIRTPSSFRVDASSLSSRDPLPR